MFTGQFFYKPSETVMGDMGIDVRDSDGNVRDARGGPLSWGIWGSTSETVTAM